MANFPFVSITNINVRLSLKEVTDGGISTVAAIGTFIPFNKTFLDVRSIVVTAKKNATHNVIAVYDFGTETDGGFTAYVYRRDTGAGIIGEVSWAIRGV